MKFSVIKWQKLWWTISAVIILGGIVAMGISYATIGSPLRPGLDFIGGTRFQVQLDCSIAGNCDRPLEVGKIREIIDEQGLGGSTIQILEGNTLSIRSKPLDVDARTKLQTAIDTKVGRLNPSTLQVDTVGPTLGKELFSAGLLALILAFFGIAAYLSFRFQLDYAFFAILALFHDILITVGVFAILGLVAGIEVDSLFIVALLTIIGFSVNDTVVIYDRLRENIVLHPDQSVNEVVDGAVNQTLARSINTTMTALLPLVSIYLFGGETLKYFALALIIGFVMGAYSSIFIASSLLAWWRNRNPSQVTA